jgi:hypothetical protein
MEDGILIGKEEAGLDWFDVSKNDIKFITIPSCTDQ